jgi:hypothetical protein
MLSWAQPYHALGALGHAACLPFPLVVTGPARLRGPCEIGVTFSVTSEPGNAGDRPARAHFHRAFVAESEGLGRDAQPSGAKARVSLAESAAPLAKERISLVESIDPFEEQRASLAESPIPLAEAGPPPVESVDSLAEAPGPLVESVVPFA